jgi:hypothetical protein
MAGGFSGISIAADCVSPQRDIYNFHCRFRRFFHTEYFAIIVGGWNDRIVKFPAFFSQYPIRFTPNPQFVSQKEDVVNGLMC